MEDYGDSDHDVLHKSISNAQDKSSTSVHIEVKFPKIPASSWLASPSKVSL